MVMSYQIFSYNSNANSSRSNILLYSSIDNSVFLPLDFSGANVGAHVGNQDLAFSFLEGESSFWEFYTVHSFIIAEM